MGPVAGTGPRDILLDPSCKQVRGTGPCDQLKMNQSLISIFKSSHNSARSCFKMATLEQSEQSGEQIEQTVGINIEDWSVISTRMVIDFYKSNPMLWDKTHKDNGNQHKTTKVLGPLVAKFMKASPPRNIKEIKKRWHGIRSTFLRHMKKEDPSTTKWVYWNDLSFLREKMASQESELDEMSWSDADIGM